MPIKSVEKSVEFSELSGSYYNFQGESPILQFQIYIEFSDKIYFLIGRQNGKCQIYIFNPDLEKIKDAPLHFLYDEKYMTLLEITLFSPISQILFYSNNVCSTIYNENVFFFILTKRNLNYNRVYYQNYL